jgi:hypothetical protein
MMTSVQRINRDEAALKALLKGESPSKVAPRFGLSRVQLWRRVGKRYQSIIETRPSANAKP